MDLLDVAWLILGAIFMLGIFIVNKLDEISKDVKHMRNLASDNYDYYYTKRD